MLLIYLVLMIFLNLARCQIVYFYKDLYLEDVLGNSLAQGVHGQSSASIVFEATQLLVSETVNEIQQRFDNSEL